MLNREETSTDEEIFDVISDFLRHRLAERHALVGVVLLVSQTIVHQFFDDPRRLLNRKQRRRLKAIRIFVLDLLDTPSVHVDPLNAQPGASSTCMLLGRRHCLQRQQRSTSDLS